MAEVFRSNGQDFYIPKITISLVNETDTERCLFFLFGSIPSLLKVQRIAKIFVFYRCCDSLHLVLFFESQEAAASLPPSVCKDAEDRRATTSFPLHFRIFSEKQSCCSIFPLRCAKVQRIAKRPFHFLCTKDSNFRFAEPRQSSRPPYIKNPSVSWDSGGLQGICRANALHKIPPSKKYIIAFEGA